MRDVENTVRYLKDDGVIFLHDCNPPFELAGRRAESWDDFMAQQKGPLMIGIWNGDVWKSIVQLRSTRPDLLVGVLKCDQGVGFVRKGSPESTLALLAGAGRGAHLRGSQGRPQALAQPEATPVSRRISRREHRISLRRKDAHPESERPRSAMKFVLATWGSRGDIEPSRRCRS